MEKGEKAEEGRCGIYFQEREKKKGVVNRHIYFISFSRKVLEKLNE